MRTDLEVAVEGRPGTEQPGRLFGHLDLLLVERRQRVAERAEKRRDIPQAAFELEIDRGVARVMAHAVGDELVEIDLWIKMEDVRQKVTKARAPRGIAVNELKVGLVTPRHGERLARLSSSTSQPPHTPSAQGQGTCGTQPLATIHDRRLFRLAAPSASFISRDRSKRRP